MFKRALRSLSCLGLAVLLAAAAPAGVLNTGTPVNFSADDVAHDDQNQTVTATGHVELVQGARILRAPADSPQTASAQGAPPNAPKVGPRLLGALVAARGLGGTASASRKADVRAGH